MKQTARSVLDDRLFMACAQNDLQTVRYLLTSPDLTEHADIHAGHDWASVLAERHEDLFTYLASSTELISHTSFKLATMVASERGYLPLLKILLRDQVEEISHLLPTAATQIDVVRYLIEEKKFISQINDAFVMACEKGCVEVVRYLADYEVDFEAGVNSADQHGEQGVLQCLILEKNVAVTEAMKIMPHARKLIEIRDTKQSLEQTIIDSEKLLKTIKI